MQMHQQSNGVAGFFSLVAQSLSQQQMIAILESFGGTRLYLPKNVLPDHPLAMAIGVEAAMKLVDAIGHGSIRVPVGRDIRAAFYRANGDSYAKIAKRLGMSETGVARLIYRISAIEI